MTDFKEFIKPTIAKIIIFLILMGGLNYILISTTVIFDATIMVGVPLGFWPSGSFLIARLDAPAPPIVEFSWIGFIIDIIFWYFIACMIMAWYKSEKRWKIALATTSFIVTLFIVLFLFVNLGNGRWGIELKPLFNILIGLIILGAYFYILKITKAFGLWKA